MKVSRIKCLMAFAVLVMMAGQLSAVPIAYLDSSQFAYQYEMNVSPNTQDLDGNNGTSIHKDFFTNTALIPVGSGLATNSAQDQIFRGDFNGGGGSIWRSAIPNGDYTLEFSVEILSNGTSEAGLGSMGLALEKPIDAGKGLRLNVGRNGQSTSSGGTVNFDLGPDDNTGGQHIFRVVHEGSGQYYIFRDGVALNGGSAITGANNANNDNIFIGDFSGSLQGDYSIDYLRLTPGSFAPPIPEPATTLLLMTGGIALARRRRQNPKA